MFTGIITDIGRIIALDQRGDLRARIATRYDVAGIDIGASIACEGVCLTVIDRGYEVGEGFQTRVHAEPRSRPEGWFDVDISAETVSKTNIGRNRWSLGRRINLERALRVGDELGGHIVSGHVDGVAEVIGLRTEGDSTRVTFRAPETLAGFIAPKGSIALNGTSLTVNEVQGAEFGVNLIPHTQAVTTWGDVAVGDPINLEVDTLARYVARLREWGA
ncbi:MAG: riboflavin synthase [Rhodobacteraceae bacterium]|nr:riboflavin synthase [Paracoccaceae bacterium]